jgi:hypothetical protein
VILTTLYLRNCCKVSHVWRCVGIKLVTFKFKTIPFGAVEALSKNSHIGLFCTHNLLRRWYVMVLAGKPEGKWPLWIPRSIWVDAIKIDPKGTEGVVLIRIIWLGIMEWTFGFHKLLEFSWINELLTSKEEPWSVALVIRAEIAQSV